MTTRRLLSLDVMRGLTVALMILVNNAGDGAVSYAQLRHSIWNGCTVTDTVFPMFLFVAGASIELSFRGRLDRGASRSEIFLQVLRRSLSIAVLGLLLNLFASGHFAELRYYGVLQRIAICYFVAAMVFLFGGIRACGVVVVAMLLGYWFLLVHVRVPGFGMPGVDVALLDPLGNLTSWLDRFLVPAAHLYRNGVYDPEGLLSTLPAVATTLFGVLSAAGLRTTVSVRRRVVVLFGMGMIVLACGLWWSHSFPMNKRLWTSSFVLFNAGLDMAVWAVLFYLIDGRRGGKELQISNVAIKPWIIYGRNALTAYAFSEVLAIALAAIHLPGGRDLQRYLFHLLPATPSSPGLGSLIYSVLFVGVCFLPVWFLYRQRVFLKL